MRTYKKRIITDVVSVGMLLLAVGLILLMHRYMGDVKSIYLPEAKQRECHLILDSGGQ